MVNGVRVGIDSGKPIRQSGGNDALRDAISRGEYSAADLDITQFPEFKALLDQNTQQAERLKGIETQQKQESIQGMQAERQAMGAEELSTVPTYAVQEGDTLSKIAKDRGVKLADLIAANPNIKDPNLINIGQNLNIPGVPGQVSPTDTDIGLSAAKASGMPPPQTAAEAMAALQDFTRTPPTAPEINPIEQALAEDEYWQSLQDERQELVSEANQKKELQGFLKKMERASAEVADLDTEMMNMKQLIDVGTEEDVRTEIIKSGGLATEAQVQALTNAKNKVLIRNYNDLVNRRNAAQQHLDNLQDMYQDEVKFAQDAEKALRTFDKDMMQYKEKFVSNATSQYNKLVDKIGYDGLYQLTGGDSYSTNLIEKTLGLGSGGLAMIASLPPSEKEQLDILSKKLGIQKALIDIKKASTTTDENGEVSPTVMYYSQLLEEGKISLSNVPQNIRNSVVSFNQGNISKPLSDTAIKEVTQTQSALDNLTVLRDVIKNNLQYIGPVQGLQRFNPYSKARQTQAEVDRVRQIVGKALEGGVLRKEDEEKYKKILATLADTPETALYKIDALTGQLERDINTYKRTQAQSGRYVPGYGGELPSPENLRSKYDY